MDKFNYTMLCDFYELTMGNGYFVSGMQEKISYFDLFFRQIPDGGGFAIACGLEQVIDYIENLHFDEEDIEFLRSKGIFDEGFLEYLKDFRFTGDIFAVPEGTVVFPNMIDVSKRAYYNGESTCGAGSACGNLSSALHKSSDTYCNKG